MKKILYMVVKTALNIFANRLKTKNLGTKKNKKPLK